METQNAVQTLKDQISAVDGPRIQDVTTYAISNRVGFHYMDGHIMLANFEKIYARPWNNCIPLEKLSKDNLPPFFVRLRDDQVGHLGLWAESKEGMPRVKLAFY